MAHGIAKPRVGYRAGVVALVLVAALVSGNAIGMQMAVMGLQAMRTQLPQAIVPQIALLANPAIQADKAQSAGEAIINRINSWTRSR